MNNPLCPYISRDLTQNPTGTEAEHNLNGIELKNRFWVFWGFFTFQQVSQDSAHPKHFHSSEGMPSIGLPSLGSLSPGNPTSVLTHTRTMHEAFT